MPAPRVEVGVLLPTREAVMSGRPEAGPLLEMAERHSEALRSVTRLANAAAHEINNPLAVIMVDLDLLSQQVASNPLALGRIGRAREAVRRVEEANRIRGIFP